MSIEIELPVQQFHIRDGVKTFKFTGSLLASSSSYTRGKTRWVEFSLYRTKNLYVVSRVGMSLFFHADHCPTVTRNRLSPVDESELSGAHVPCPDCKPPRISVDGVFPETPRYWAQDTATAQGVVASLMKYDDNGTRYLTNVARRLLEDAAKVDPAIADAFYIDEIE